MDVQAYRRTDFRPPDGPAPDAEPEGSRSTRAMSTEPPPPGSGQPPEEDPFKKQPPPSGGSPYDAPSGSRPPPSAGDPYGGGPYDTDPLAGMPPLADSGKRMLARIIDMIIVFVVVGLLGWAFGLVEFTMDADDTNYAESTGLSGIAVVLYIAYDTYFTAKNGQTLGQAADEAADREPHRRLHALRGDRTAARGRAVDPVRVLLCLPLDGHRGRLELLRQALQAGPP